MRALVVYESMFGNTHEIANCIGDGLGQHHTVLVRRVGDVTNDLVQGVDLLVVGGPTHVRGLSRRQTRLSAEKMAAKEGSTLELERDAVQFGLREWLPALRVHDGMVAAAFDTRADGPPLFTGRASRRIEKRLRKLGLHVVATKSFLIDGEGHLAPGETDKARSWGATLGVVAAVEREPAA